MPFTKWYAQLYQSLKDGVAVDVVAEDGNTWTVNLVKLFNQIGWGNGGNPIINTDFKLYSEISRDTPTFSAISDTPTGDYSTAQVTIPAGAPITIAETAIFADTIDSLSAHHSVMIRRDLNSPPFVTQPSTSYVLTKRVAVTFLP